MSDEQRCGVCHRLYLWGEDEDSQAVADAGMPSCRTNAFWKLSLHMRADHPDQLWTCPRRRESFVAARDENVDYWRRGTDGTSCSYCGSMQPDRVFECIEAGMQITPTDKNYKVYVGGHRKAYFQHFDEAEKKRFIALFNSKKMKLAYPGHFYVAPYFMSFAPK